MRETLRETFPDHPVALVVAMAADKDARAVARQLRAIRPVAVVFTAVPIVGSFERAAPPGSISLLCIS